MQSGAVGLACACVALAACSGNVESPAGDEGPGAGSGAPGGSAGPAAPGTLPAGERPEGFGEPIDPRGVTFSCDPAADPSPSPLIRLSMRQYANALRDLLEAYGQGDLNASLEPVLGRFPIDGEQDASFRHMDGRVSQRHVDGYFEVADLLSRELTAPTRLAAIAGDCAGATAVDAACLSAFIEGFGARVQRRPLAAEEVDRYAELNEAGVAPAEVYRGVVFTLLMAPQFLYHLQIQGDPVAGREEVLSLSPHELASRLSFHFWQTAPDDALTAAADDGSLLTDAGYEAQVARLFDDPRAEQTVLDFFADWYRLEIFGGFATTPAFDTFADGLAADDQLYADAVAEVEAMIRHYTYDTAGNYADLLSSDLVFASSPALAELYGVAPWDGASAPASFPDGERAGLLTRAAMLISSNHTTNPFKRGAFVLRDVLCVPVEPPADLPPGSLTPPPFDPMASTRQRFEDKVSSPTCAGCHSTFTPYGMALEAYDGLGRFRTEERLIDDTGEELGTVPVDTLVSADVDGNQVALDGPVALSQALGDSELARECFARHYFRYTYRRNEQIGDECAMSDVLQNVAAGGSLAAALRDVALQPAFRLKVTE